MDHVVFGLVCLLVIGIFAWIAEPIAHLGLKNPPAEDSAYNLLVQGFRAGQLNLKIEPPAGFAQLADPYHLAPDSPYMRELTDMSYYGGKLYLYFGVTPVLVLFWPYAALTGHYLPENDAVVIFLRWASSSLPAYCMQFGGVTSRKQVSGWLRSACWALF